MVLKKLEDECWCSVCDNAIAVVELSHNGSLRPFWHNPTDGEIGFCKDCFNKLKYLVNNFNFEE